MVIGERELSISESLCYELTNLPASLFTEKQRMRKTNKAVLGKELKSRVNSTIAQNIAVTVIDGGWLIHQVCFDYSLIVMVHELKFIVYHFSLLNIVYVLQ